MATAAQRLAAAETAMSREEVESELAQHSTPLRAAYVRTDPVRSTVDLGPARHAKLSAWQDETSIELGLPPGKRGVTRQDVLDELVALLIKDQRTRDLLVKQLDQRDRIRQARRVRERRAQ